MSELPTWYFVDKELGLCWEWRNLAKKMLSSVAKWRNPEKQRRIHNTSDQQHEKIYRKCLDSLYLVLKEMNDPKQVNRGVA